MADQINTGDITNSEAIAIGHGAKATVIRYDGTPPAFPLDNLPPPNPNFTGREDFLADIAVNFTSGASSPLVLTQAIAGLGGVGKTQLALAYAHGHRDAYDLIWQLRADDPTTLDGDLRGLGTALHLPVQHADAPTARRLVLGWLNGGHKRWLLLYDNVDTMTARELRPYLPSGEGHVLITSRRPHWREAKTMRLDVFTAVEAAAFWTKRIEREIEIEEEGTLAELAKELGRLPLALEQAAAYMMTRRKRAGQYLGLYRQRRRDLWQRQPPPDDYDKTITTTWEMAFDHARQTPGAAELLNLCCFLASDDIPLGMITAHADALPDELAAVIADELARDDALAALGAYSLLQRDEEALAVHRLVQTVARDRMGEERAKIWVEAATELIVSTLPDWTRLYEWEEGRRILSHMIAVAELGLELAWETERLAFLCSWVGGYLQYLGDYLAAQPYHERALSIREKALGLEHPITANSLNNLGALLQMMGELAAAKPYFERALTIFEESMGRDHPDTADSLNNLGALLDLMGEYVESRLYYERALDIYEKVLGSDHPNTATSLNNLGTLLVSMGDLAAAQHYYERALAIREKAFGADHPDTASSLNNLGYLLKTEGDYAAALPYFERALAIQENAFGPDHPHIANSLYNLGEILKTEGDYATAQSYFERALAICEDKLGRDHPDTKTVRGILQSL